MPILLFKKMGLGSPRPTRMVIQLTECSLTKPNRIVEDVFVQVGSFIFLVNFIILDFDADPEVPFILGRSFLVIRHALIDVSLGQLIMKDYDMVEVFDVQKEMNLTKIYNEFFSITVIDPNSELPLITSKDPLEKELEGYDNFCDA